ncbi:MAG: AAA family ATPase [Planctomycetia bacterium]|nr:AAA family ATPase [Planctomycetia bacterium]
MSVLIPESELPQDLANEDVVEAAYASELAEVASKLNRCLPTLIECDKDLTPFLYLNIRNRLRAFNLRCVYLDGRPRENDQQGPVPLGLMGTMIAHLREAVRGAVERRVVVLPHLDLLTTSQGGLTGEAKEVVTLLYENPDLVWLGFKDPSFQLPKVIENLFPYRTSLLGINRTRLRQLITRKESRKFGVGGFNPWGLYKYVSGINAVRLRKLLCTLEGEDYPADPKAAYKQVRQATLDGTLEVPTISMNGDIGGYAKVKEQIRNEVLNLLARKESLTNEAEIKNIEELIPKGMIFWGPPGTGKTLFAKAMASEIGAAVTVVSGPELKSKWVGESEDNIRQIFHKARQSAPAIIVFDELDSFATARGTYTGSGVEHSMVNQLLTEMDGFHKEEMVFVVGTTNFVESLDPALLRPGRFEFHLHIPYPDSDARREIIKIYDKKMSLKMSDEAIDYAVRRTGHGYQTATGTPFSGDHINAMARSMARIRLRESRQNEPSTPQDVERALTEYDEKPTMKPSEERLVATHESGHAVCALFCPNYPAIERITIRSEMSWAGGYVRFKHEPNEIGMMRERIMEELVVLCGGIESERLLLGDVSTGAAGSDLERVTSTARWMVEYGGMGSNTGLRQFLSNHENTRGRRLNELSDEQKAVLDREVNQIIGDAQKRAAHILRENKVLLETLRDLVLEKKTIDSKTLREAFPDAPHKKEDDQQSVRAGNGSEGKKGSAVTDASGSVPPAEKKSRSKKDAERGT